jgi:hypothetical protein
MSAVGAALAVPEGRENLFRLALAALLGVGLTFLARRERRPSRTLAQPLAQAQVLLAVGGALLVMVIGDSLARAFSVAGAAGIIRFRTPVENPRDTLLLLLLLALGMACGLGLYGPALAAAAFLGGLLAAMDGLRKDPARLLQLDVTSEPGAPPAGQVEAVLARAGASFEARQVAAGPTPSVRYQVSLGTGQSLAELNAALLQAEGIRSVAWAAPKRSEPA